MTAIASIQATYTNYSDDGTNMPVARHRRKPAPAREHPGTPDG